jgi:hypothetical protein
MLKWPGRNCVGCVGNLKETRAIRLSNMGGGFQLFTAYVVSPFEFALCGDNIDFVQNGSLFRQLMRDMAQMQVLVRSDFRIALAYE